MSSQAWWQQPAKAIDQAARAQAQARQQVLTKPSGSLGQLEQLAIELAGMQGRELPQVDAVSICVFAGDHGIAAEGVSAYPQAVTGQMLANFVNGGAAISVLARSLGAHMQVIDLGTATALPELAGVKHLTLGGARPILPTPVP
uniref:Nicotinate-nucleotide--dimethylbenzimidazole phosphoribosyltransferase n=1 Tax=Pseudomonas marincola TaxID=437900 RepID=A0A653EA45_9PSED